MRDLLVGDGDQDVTLGEPRDLGRTARQEPRHDDVTAENIGEEPEPRPRRARRPPSEAYELVAVLAIVRDRHGEREASDLVQVERHDAGEATAPIDERPAAETGIHRRREDRGLEHVLPVGVERVERGDAAELARRPAAPMLATMKTSSPTSAGGSAAANGKA